MTLTRLSLSVATASLLLVGAGCLTKPAAPATNTQPTTSATAEWRLTFDLPSGWIMTEGCELGGERVSCGKNIVDGPVPTLDLAVEANAETVYLQNTTLLPLFGGIGPAAEVENLYKSENIALITVSHDLSGAVGAPAYGIKTESLGNGFYKVTTCDLVTTPECEIYGGSAYDYYLVTASGDRYKFTFNSSGVSEATIKAIILSAEAR